MALQVGELLASLTVDTGGVEQAMRIVEELGVNAGETLRQALGMEAGESVTAALMAGMENGVRAGQPGLTAAMAQAGAAAVRAAEARLSGAAGEAIGSRFVQGIIEGIAAGRSGIEKAADMGRLTEGLLSQAMPAGRSAAAKADGAARESAAETDGQRARTGESEAAFARMVASALEGVSVRLDGAAVGSLVAPAVSRSIAENAAARRYGTV